MKTKLPSHCHLGGLRGPAGRRRPPGSNEEFPLCLSCPGRKGTGPGPTTCGRHGHEPVRSAALKPGSTDWIPSKLLFPNPLREKNTRTVCMSVQECQLFFLIDKNSLYSGIMFFFWYKGIHLKMLILKWSLDDSKWPFFIINVFTGQNKMLAILF